MDSLIAAAARALAAGDPLGALKRVALLNEPPALALRGIAMAQLGDFTRAKMLLRRAARGFGRREPAARARCVLAEAEVALASRDLAFPARTLDAARTTLGAHGDQHNAAHAQLLEARYLLLIGRLDQAERLLARLDSTLLPPALLATRELATAGIAIRRVRIEEAAAALTRADRAARRAAIPALLREVESARRLLAAPAARLFASGRKRTVRLTEIDALLRSKVLVVDACRRVVRASNRVVSLVRRPVLFALARALAEASPDEVPRDALITRAFGVSRVNESHRARLRVELARLRALFRTLAELRATPRGFVLEPSQPHPAAVLAPLEEGEHAALLALLADGESWSSSALALALGASQRTVQRALDALFAADRIQAVGRGRARRFLIPPPPGIATLLLLPTPPPLE